MFSGLEILVFGALAFVFITGKNDRKALGLRVDRAEQELRSLRAWVQRHKASTRSQADVLNWLHSSAKPVHIRLRDGKQCTGYARGIQDEHLLLEGLATPYDDPNDAAARTEPIPLQQIQSYIDEANHWQPMPLAVVTSDTASEATSEP